MESDMHNSMFPKVDEANGQSAHWMKRSLEVLEYTRSKHAESLEDVQAVVILIFVVIDIVGTASQARYLLTTAISMAKELNLHRIDHANNAFINIPSRPSAKSEICRRVWWYIVATDWQASQMSGPQKGTYSIKLSQTMINKPVNASDEDLIDEIIVNKPLSEPTSISYCIQRIRLGEFCRQMTDSEIFSQSGVGPLNYEHIKKIDAKIGKFVESLPPFFSLELDLDEIQKVNTERSIGIIMQRHIMNFMLHAQRCRIHLPYLPRLIKDPVYEYYRKACMEAARQVLRTESQLSMERLPFVQNTAKETRQQKTPDDQSEVLGAFALLEEFRGASPFAGNILESFKTILNRHNAAVFKDPAMEISDCDGVRYRYSSTAFLTDETINDVSTNSTLPALDDLWRMFQDTSSTAAVNWDSLFTELENSSLSMY